MRAGGRAAWKNDYRRGVGSGKVGSPRGATLPKNEYSYIAAQSFHWLKVS